MAPFTAAAEIGARDTTVHPCDRRALTVCLMTIATEAVCP